MEDELWIEKELERIRREFSLTDEQLNRFRDKRSLESLITQERIKGNSSALESNDSGKRQDAIAKIFAWVLNSALRTFKIQWKGYERTLTQVTEQLLTMITSQERRLAEVEQELQCLKSQKKEAA
jgi:hypothetical protein